MSRLRQSRREFLVGFSGAALAGLGAENRLYNPILAAQTYVWLLEFQFRNQPLAQALDEVFSGTHRAGYSRVELMPEFLNRELRDRTLASLRKNKIEPSILYYSGPLIEKAAAEASRMQTVRLAEILEGAGVRAVNFSAAVQPRNSAELETEAYELNRMADDLGRLDMRLMVHHHLPEMQEDARQWRYLVAHTEPDLVDFCVDLDWAARGGVSPLGLIEEAGDRLLSLHVRNTRNGANLEEVGEGDIDLTVVARLLRQMNYGGFLVVELLYDKGTLREENLSTALSHSRLYMQKVFGSRPGMLPVDFGPHVRVKT